MFFIATHFADRIGKRSKQEVYGRNVAGFLEVFRMNTRKRPERQVACIVIYAYD